MTVKIWWDGTHVNLETYKHSKRWYCEEGFPSPQYFLNLIKVELLSASMRNLPGENIEVFFGKTYNEDFNALHKYCKEHKNDLGAVVY